MSQRKFGFRDLLGGKNTHGLDSKRKSKNRSTGIDLGKKVLSPFLTIFLSQCFLIPVVRGPPFGSRVILYLPIGLESLRGFKIYIYIYIYEYNII